MFLHSHSSTTNGTIMADVDAIVEKMRESPTGIRFSELCKVCDHSFGPARQRGSSHRVYKTPWTGDPRVNLQSDRGKAKPYQVRQVLRALARLQEES
jgi:hypothetical protein